MLYVKLYTCGRRVSACGRGVRPNHACMRRHRRMRRETQETNKTVVAELELEAPFSAKQKGVLHVISIDQ